MGGSGPVSRGSAEVDVKAGGEFLKKWNFSFEWKARGDRERSRKKMK